MLGCLVLGRLFAPPRSGCSGPVGAWGRVCFSVVLGSFVAQQERGPSLGGGGGVLGVFRSKSQCSGLCSPLAPPNYPLVECPLFPLAVP